MNVESRPFRKSRFGRRKEGCKVSVVTDLKLPLLSSSDAPRVYLPRVELHRNMHQYNGLFETSHELPADQVEPLLTAQHLSGTTNGDAPSAEWSSAVGHAATGKSSRVIHNLQEDIARLTRECSVYRSRAEEMQRINDVFRMQMQTMTEQIRNLELANETNLHSITRKDRKIENLRLEAQNERDRRQRAESKTEGMSQIMAKDKDEFNRKCAELQEMMNHARIQYDVLAAARQREQADEQRKLKAICDSLITLRRENEKRNSHVEHLEAIMAEKNREIKANKENFEKIVRLYDVYRATRDQEMRDLVEKAYQSEIDIDSALASLKLTEGQMKWTISVKNGTRDAH